MQIKYLNNPTKQDLKVIDYFLESQPHANFFQSSAFFESCKLSSKLTPFYLLAFENEALTGVLMFYRQYQINLPILRFLSTRNIVWGGPIVKDNNTQVAQNLLNQYEKVISKVIYTQVRNLFDCSVFNETFIKAGFEYEPHLNILVNLEKSEEELWKEVHAKRRNEIRRARKEGTVFSLENNSKSLKACYEILKEVYERAKLPLPDFGHFEAIFNSDCLKVFVAKYEENIIGCMLCITYKDKIFDYYAGAYSKYYSKYPNDLIPWEVFKWAKSNAFKAFDFGGAGKPNVPYGVRNYKIKFGGELVSYGRYSKIHHARLYKMVTSLFEVYRRVKQLI